MTNMLSNGKSTLSRVSLRHLFSRVEVVFGLVVVILFILTALFADLIVLRPPHKISIDCLTVPPVWSDNIPEGCTDPPFIFGTDYLGHDVFSRAIYGTRTALQLVLTTIPIVILLGAVIGLLSGYSGGWVDNLLMRFADVFYAFPPILFFILVVLVLRHTAVGQWLNGIFMLSAAYATVGWVGLARLVRSAVLSVKEMEYIEAARCVGARDIRVILRHILPNIGSLILVWVTLLVPQVIIMESILGYLGIGLTQLVKLRNEELFLVSWGGMLQEGRRAINSFPLLIIVPIVAVGLVSLGFTLLGDGLRDALDPQMRER